MIRSRITIIEIEEIRTLRNIKEFFLMIITAGTIMINIAEKKQSKRFRLNCPEATE
jgi:hypothetical protein